MIVHMFQDNRVMQSSTDVLVATIGFAIGARIQ